MQRLSRVCEHTSSPATSTSGSEASTFGRLSVQALSWKYVDGRGGLVGAPDGAIEAVLSWAAAQQITTVDVEDRLFTSTEPAYLAALRADAARLCVGWGYLGITVDFGAKLSRASVEAEIALGRQWIDVAAALGVPRLRVPGNAVGGVEPAQAWALVRSKLQALVAYGRDKGVAIGLHNHAGSGDAIPATGTSLLRMVDEVPGLQLILDLGNGNFTGCPELHTPGETAPEQLYEHIRIAAPRATSVRAKFVHQQHMNTGRAVEGFVDYRRVARLLRDGGFDGDVSIVRYDSVCPDLAPADALSLAAEELRRCGVG